MPLLIGGRRFVTTELWKQGGPFPASLGSIDAVGSRIPSQTNSVDSAAMSPSILTAKHFFEAVQQGCTDDVAKLLAVGKRYDLNSAALYSQSKVPFGLVGFESSTVILHVNDCQCVLFLSRTIHLKAQATIGRG